ncbi:MAG: hypothetical protein KF862_07740 [Chitinophagaceae bacterium]|nr:hypothetical protein [Chitinophagaceae bacterium]
MSSIKVGPYQYNYAVHRGKVLSIDSKLESVISGSTGGAQVIGNQVYVSPGSISSSSLNHQNFYLQDAGGKQFHIKLVGWDMPGAPDNEIIFVLVEKVENGVRRYLAVRNLTLDEYWIANAYIKEFVSYKPDTKSSLVAIAVAVAAYFLATKLLGMGIFSGGVMAVAGFAIMAAINKSRFTRVQLQFEADLKKQLREIAFRESQA